MNFALAFPTARHSEVADIASSFFESKALAVLVTASCARGSAVPESDLDMIALVRGADREAVELDWDAYRAVAVEGFTLHLDVVDGSYVPTIWDDGGGPDDFEVEIGNHVAYSALLWQTGTAFDDLRSRWLPYYDQDLAVRRLAMARDAALLDLRFVPGYVERGLTFQAFDRLYKAFREFLQALFISRRTYPIAYNKWIRQQVVDILGEPDLYAALPGVLEVSDFDGAGILANAALLNELISTWIV